MSRRRASAVYLVYVYSLFGLRSPVEKVEGTARKEEVRNGNAAREHGLWRKEHRSEPSA